MNHRKQHCFIFAITLSNPVVFRSYLAHNYFS